ncbi:N-acetyl-gamma-glutamyl-phosphate reductase [Ferribacterium limneticum]|uniref:N-acetyl-gamma-glutamyl-phosphate reductase n=1 Tax=Ferribacterium limneticum TaxID=76259 RepID=UPI001CF8144F|nr:N-acetyl-gamma-glutamyl-phosphate reductase [Ferribacterium limneticum]UCV26848.1 N-acetyl-gamma-glutamyl-phosphate reductase [Ferribacterium limneticum]UCV30765.1 N-acetyl-gamma-glutamyl-phosphate reductase [Ferribacterium limneticum]
MTYKVFVDGQEGTTGLQINEYLAKRSDVVLLKIDSDKRKDLAERKRLINESDVTFLCLPDDAAKESVSLVDNPNTCVIDASTAHRVNPAWTFGLPELAKDQRAKIKASKRIANPGCHASAFILALRPLVEAGLLPAATQIAANSITGYSGGGKSMIADYQKAAESQTALKAPRPYSLGLAHKHLPEMQAYTGLTVAPIFQPIVGPFYKGLAVTAYIHPQQFTRPATPAEVQKIIADYYAGEPFIRVLPVDLDATTEGGFYNVEANNDTNRVDIAVFGNEERMLIVARLDNLGKGASGAAVQAMNVHLGVEESLGLV